MLIKKCNKCGIDRALSEFGCDNRRPDKKRTICKVCCRAYDSKRSKTQKRKDYMKGIMKDYRESGKATESCRVYRNNNPEKYKAHKIASTAIRNKKIIKEPCEKCGSLITYAHHDDYSKPLTVRWLCDYHHREWHKINGGGLNG